MVDSYRNMPKMPATSKGNNCRAIIQAVWSDGSVTHCAVVENLDAWRVLGNAAADTASRWLVKYKLFHPDDSDLLSLAIRNAAALTKLKRNADSKQDGGKKRGRRRC